jgi:hypothetical protein
MDRIDFENSGAVERTERIREAERVRGDERKRHREKKERRERRKRKPADPEAESKRDGRKTGSNLDIEA